MTKLRLLIRLRDHIDTVARRSPARLALGIFALIILFFTSLLLLPQARSAHTSAPFLTALFTATSATCVTGLTVVDTATYWSTFGHVVIAFSMQIGALGVMTLASLLGLAVSRRIGLTQRILTADETKSRLGEVGGLLRTVVATSLIAESILTLALLPSSLTVASNFGTAVGQSIFMAISVFNNGGFVIYDAGITGFVGSWIFAVPVIVGTFIGALGFPVILNISRNWRKPQRWSLTSKITLTTSISLFILGAIGIFTLEWNNAHTYGNLQLHERILAAMFHSITPRSSGLSTLDISKMHESTWFFTDILMFIGGGSGGTGGGIKVTTFAILLLAIIAEARGDQDVEVYGRRIPATVTRLAISITFLGAVLVGTSTLAILHITDLPLSRVLFETISAFATTGLSTGITPILPPAAQTILIALMYLGRVGTVTTAAALALRYRRRVIRMPEEQPLVG
ncbi:Trk-type K+ transport system membrane component [Arcanobacterium pluranimalium]|uniref:TrkH family potassium uptake protein n=1 Tax=Arcanobacterium pluranimalium TaxID=108028 RepID=UPI00308416A5|nr:Trk-type K+ transport system membrane component [Arcanobacterium pluranimalium]